MFRRASAILMPTESDKAVRANEKKAAAVEAEAKKQRKLADRRAQICVTAQATAPLVHRSSIPDCQDSCPSPTSPIKITSTGETPFKGARRHNPLNEKRVLEREEEKLQIAAISDHYGVNMSDAKVMLAKNPMLKRPSIKRNRTSEGEMSFASHSSSTPSTPTTPSSPLARMPSYSSSPSGIVLDSPKIDPNTFPFPKTRVKHMPKSEIVRQGSVESLPQIMHHSPLIRAQRPHLAHVQTGMSTFSVDTAMVRPMSYLRLDTSGGETSSIPPGSPAITTYGSPWMGGDTPIPNRGGFNSGTSSPLVGSPLASPSLYSISSYMRSEAPVDATDDRQTFRSIPRTVGATRPKMHSTDTSTSTDSWRSLRDERFVGEVNDSMLYDMAARV